MSDYDLSIPGGRERWQTLLAKADAGDREARLTVIRTRLAKATPGPWYWDSYSQIGAQVPEGHPLDYAPEDHRLNVSGKKIAILAWMEGGPSQKGRGDELHVPEARANADLISEAPSDIAWLLDQNRQLREALDDAWTWHEDIRRRAFDLVAVASFNAPWIKSNWGLRLGTEAAAETGERPEGNDVT